MSIFDNPRPALETERNTLLAALGNEAIVPIWAAGLSAGQGSVRKITNGFSAGNNNSSSFPDNSGIIYTPLFAAAEDSSGASERTLASNFPIDLTFATEVVLRFRTTGAGTESHRRVFLSVGADRGTSHTDSPAATIRHSGLAPTWSYLVLDVRDVVGEYYIKVSAVGNQAGVRSVVEFDFLGIIQPAAQKDRRIRRQDLTGSFTGFRDVNVSVPGGAEFNMPAARGAIIRAAAPGAESLTGTIQCRASPSDSLGVGSDQLFRISGGIAEDGFGIFYIGVEAGIYEDIDANEIMAGSSAFYHAPLPLVEGDRLRIRLESDEVDPATNYFVRITWLY